MDSWQKFDETLFREKKEFYNNLTIESITAKSMQKESFGIEKRVLEDFWIESLGEYHHSIVKSNILLLADVFENFRKKCNIYEY